jgi:hypothetical protein
VVEDGRLVATFEVPVERPRRRDHPAVARLTGQVLDAIFGGAAERAVSGEFGRAAAPRAEQDEPAVLPFPRRAAVPR